MTGCEKIVYQKIHETLEAIAGAEDVPARVAKGMRPRPVPMPEEDRDDEGDEDAPQPST